MTIWRDGLLFIARRKNQTAEKAHRFSDSGSSSSMAREVLVLSRTARIRLMPTNRAKITEEFER